MNLEYLTLQKQIIALQKKYPNHPRVYKLLKKLRYKYPNETHVDCEVQLNFIKHIPLPFIWEADYVFVENEYNKLLRRFPDNLWVSEWLQRFYEKWEVRKKWEEFTRHDHYFFDRYTYFFRNVYSRSVWLLFQKKNKLPIKCKWQDVSDMIREKLLSPDPCMIGRLGSVELNYIDEYNNSFWLFRRIKFILWMRKSYKLSERERYCVFHNAWLFPSKPSILKRFSDLMISSMRKTDIFWTRCGNEDSFKNFLQHSSVVDIYDLEPYSHATPWTHALEWKKVLVIHPFSESIEMQYSKKDKIFPKPYTLPDFKLKTLKPVVSFARESVNYDDWFEAFEDMKKQIRNIDFDIAIIWCGAYWFPLAAFVKKMWKKSIHLWGPTQILFWIRWKRWDDDKKLQGFINEYWIRPSKSETPKLSDTIENGCYW